MRPSVILLLGAVALLGCRGNKSEQPPVHVFGDMDWQPKYQWGEASPLFEDGRAMRPLVDGTVAQGQLKEDDAYYRGKDEKGEFVKHVPAEVDEKMVRRGQDRFNIYCAPCHDQTGGGRGTVVQRGFPPPVELPVRSKQMADGQIFDTISNGVRNMPSYRKQIPEADRWAIVTWVRVLQHSQNASIDDVPADKRSAIEPEGAAQ